VTITLSPAELQSITGYKRAADQLRFLHDRGFYRAFKSRTTGEVVLERDHYHAVCQGIGGAAANDAARPMLRKHRQATR
jgi:hypothetical protein